MQIRGPRPIVKKSVEALPEAGEIEERGGGSGG